MPTGVDRYIANIINDAAGGTNPAQVHFDVLVGSTLTDAERCAAIVAYLSGTGEVAINTRITGITKIASGAAGGVPVPFPTVAYAAWKTHNSFLVTMAAYGVSYGAGGLTAAGSSMTVSQYTAVPGRAGTGRHYRPWLSADNVTAGGAVDPTFVAGVDDAYSATMFGVSSGPWSTTALVGLAPAVHSATAGNNAIIARTVSGTIARLRSRQR